MRLVPASLGGRLMLAATLLIAAALAVAGGLAWLTLNRFVHRQVDVALDGKIAALAAALEVAPDGSLRLARAIDADAFTRPLSGWYWQASDGRSVLRSESLAGLALRLPPPHPRRPRDFGDGPMPADGPGPRDEPLHLRIQNVPVGAGDLVTVAASAPDAALRGPVHEAMAAVALALGIAAVALIAALTMQVRLGLRPLAQLRQAVADVRTGRRERLPDDQPSEVAPLVDELNRLIAENAEGLVRARRHVANLAHGLKTPLASLAVALETPGRDPAGELGALVGLMDRRIRHHLGRARSAALAGGARARTALAPRVADLVATVQKIHADKRVAVEADLDAAIEVACEPQDLDEMLGNILDNAFTWAAATVRVTATRQGKEVAVRVEDDGPGLAADMIPDALRPGHRLDESAAGYGFGLPITRELAELYGGGLALSRSALGGLAVEITLPMAQ